MILSHDHVQFPYSGSRGRLVHDKMHRWLQLFGVVN